MQSNCGGARALAPPRPAPGLPADQRRGWGERIEAELRTVLADLPGVLGVYWPFRAEFDPRQLIDWAVAAGRVIALPVVVDKEGPLEYRAWRPGEPLVDGVWNIPVPERGAVVTPDAVLAPARRVRPRVLPAGLRRRLFRPHPGGARAATVGDRDRLRNTGTRDDPPPALRRGDGSDRHRDRDAPPVTLPAPECRGGLARAGGARAAGPAAAARRVACRR